MNLLATEAAKPTENPTALDYLLRARVASMGSAAAERYAQAIGLLEQALALDPQSVLIRSRLAQQLTARVMATMPADAADIERARALAEAALAASPRDPVAHYARAQVLRASLGHWEEAASDYDACIAGNRNFATAYAHLAQCRMLSGAIDDAIPLAERAIRLSPRDPNISDFYIRIGIAHLLQSRNDEAIAWLEKARAAAPGGGPPRAWLGAAYGLARLAADLHRDHRLMRRQTARVGHGNEGRLVDRRNAVLRRPARNDLVIGNRMTGEIGVRPLASPLLRTIARNRRQSQHPQDEREAR